MRSTLEPGGAAPEVAPGEPRRRVDGRLVVLLIVIALGARGMLGGALDVVALRTWTTVFVAIVIQALPFLVLGVLVSGAITALVSPAVLERVLPRSTLLAVPSAALAGTALPGCECASVPIAGRLCARGVQPPAALAFMLAAPVVNPVVLVATAVAFPGQPQMVLARFLGSLLTSMMSGSSGRGSGTRDGWPGPASDWQAPPGVGGAGLGSPGRPATTSGTPAAGWWWARPRRQRCRWWCPGRWWRR
jgi:hypothetical protein